MMPNKDNSSDIQRSETLGRVNGNRRVAPNPATIKAHEVMLPKAIRTEESLSIRVNLD